MIKFVQCMRRHPDLTPAEFRQQWEDYKPAWEAFAALMNAVRVSFSTTLAIEANQQLSLNRGTEEPYDGVVETWIEDAHGLEELLATPVVEAAQRDLFTRQHAFLDLGRCCFFFTADD